MSDDIFNDIIRSDTRYRAQTVLWGAKRALKIKGDFVDFGVYHGHLPFMINNLYDLHQRGKKHYLFDTWGENWNMHDDPVVLQGGKRYDKDIYDEVLQRFSRFKSSVLVRGLLPGSATEAIEKIHSIAFASIDVNSGNIEVELLRMIWDKLSNGAMVYLDDYGFRKYKNLPVAIDKFLSDKQEDVFELANGTAFILKE